MFQLSMDRSQTVNNPELWNAVVSRDASRDGSFVFAVRSTGIYCRPSCPARRPKREQVSFFQIPEAAEQAGFRACRRCHPRRASGNDPRIELARRICHAIDEHDEEPQTLKTLSVETGVSAHHLQRTFKDVMGITPRQYAEARRLKIPIVAIVDTNCDPDLVDYPIAGNDDAIRSVRLILKVVTDTITQARAEYEAKYARRKTAEEASVAEAAMAAPAAGAAEAGVAASPVVTASPA